MTFTLVIKLVGELDKSNLLACRAEWTVDIDGDVCGRHLYEFDMFLVDVVKTSFSFEILP
jgi:hypothetical protein